MEGRAHVRQRSAAAQLSPTTGRPDRRRGRAEYPAVVSASPRIALLTLGTGDHDLLRRQLTELGARVETRSALPEASGVILIGDEDVTQQWTDLRVGATARQLERRLAGGGAVLGIGAGFQAMFRYQHDGLEQWPGDVTPLSATSTPEGGAHIGWCRIRGGAGSRLLAGIEEPEFYFHHSHAVHDDPAQLGGGDTPLRLPIVSWAETPTPVVAMVENGPLSAVQFHPEKSGETGTQLLRNWLATLR